MKGELPPLPPSPAGSRGQFDQSTVRKSPNVSAESHSRLSQSHQPRQPSDEYDDDYDDQYTEAYPDPADLIEGKMNNAHLEDELPDTTMLDSVILPAIASVRVLLWLQNLIELTSLFKLFPRVSSQEARVALSALQRAFTEAERIIPGVTMELVNEIVDSVEHVEDDR
jgi:serine/threonine-protein kinase 24/25/MST4